MSWLDKFHDGNAISAWEEIRRPEPPTREQTLRKAAWATRRELVHANGNGVLDKEIPGALS
ncbi:MAG TPA: hypothetical protein VK638_43630 [Edaphobacter sp.]|nr:hypothetical protein [Edaphobacter sp.]